MLEKNGWLGSVGEFTLLGGSVRRRIHFYFIVNGVFVNVYYYISVYAYSISTIIRYVSQNEGSSDGKWRMEWNKWNGIAGSE